MIYPVVTDIYSTIANNKLIRNMPGMVRAMIPCSFYNPILRGPFDVFAHPFSLSGIRPLNYYVWKQ